MAIAGKSGGVYLGVNKVKELQSWGLDISSDTIDTSSFDSDGWKTFIAALKEWGGSFEASWAKSTDPNGQKAFYDAFIAGIPIKVKLDVDGTNYYEGDVLITGFNVEAPVDDKITLSIDFQGTGPLAYLP